MYTRVPDDHPQRELAQQAAQLILPCVHCGFCLPACPTYGLLADELDSPRGRIYLIKQMAENAGPGEVARDHLDRCLTCRACESACPSGVRYGQLVDVGRELAEQRAPRPLANRWQRGLLGAVLSRRRWFAALLGVGRRLRCALPARLAAPVPVAPQAPGPWPAARHARRMILMQGCVQPALAPAIDAAAARVMDRLGVSLIADSGAGCCGALNHHLSRTAQALAQVKANVRHWHQLLEQGAECLVISASGCAAMVKDYAHLLHEDAELAGMAQRVAAAARDLSELIGAQDFDRAGIRAAKPQRIAWQSPCTLQHAQRIRGRVESLLEAVGHGCVNRGRPRAAAGLPEPTRSCSQALGVCAPRNFGTSAPCSRRSS
ncbi:MAG: glycolate oxidase subunit GlcF [Steroidobacteraceae bacterium]